MYSMNNDNYMINIKFNNIAGILNTKSNEVMFYHFKYINIVEAISRLEQDIKQSKEEIQIFDDDLLGSLFTS